MRRSTWSPIANSDTQSVSGLTELLQIAFLIAGLWGLPKRTGNVPSMSKFDAEIFELSKGQVASMDPQERLLCELTFQLILDACMLPGEISDILYSEQFDMS